eukprot:3453180-Pleurochrysis_carterae.AAC.1
MARLSVWRDHQRPAEASVPVSAVGADLVRRVARGAPVEIVPLIWRQAVELDAQRRAASHFESNV